MAVKVYELKPDYTYYSLLPNEDNMYYKLNLSKGEIIKEFWKSTWRFYVRDLINCERGDFINLCPSSITSTNKILVNFKNILDGHGEYLESILDDTDEKLITFNPLEIYDCLDLENTVFETYNFRGKISNVAVDIHSFDIEKIGDSSIFKLPGRYVYPTYVVTGLHDEEKDFYLQYKKLGLTGLDFELVWSNE